ncbi:unnamed protein product [marine sediment metagenome]|uniref:50S ribosomal protein L3 n=1 Tax=marine sediment metagenome TaxID=412755 RepID=X1VIJ3_9ZZZZ
MEVKENRVNKPESGHFRKSEVRPQKYLREIRVKDIGNLKIRDEIRVDVFKEGDLVDVVGISKGKGFAGVVKRYGFKGGPASHGAGGWRRRPGLQDSLLIPVLEDVYLTTWTYQLYRQ